MAKTQIKATAQLFLDVSDAKSDAKKFVADIKQQLSSIETAADKMTVFKDLVKYIAQVDSALASLKAKNGDAFKHMFDGMDENFRKEFEAIFKLSGKDFGKLGALSEKLSTLTTKSGIAEIHKYAVELNELFVAMGKQPPLNIDEFKNKATKEQIDKLKNSLVDFYAVWENVSDIVRQGFGGGAGGGLSDEVENEIKELEKSAKKYKTIIDIINNPKYNKHKKTTAENEVTTIKALIKEYREVGKVAEDATKTDDERTRALGEQVRLAMLLKNTINNVADNGSNKGQDFVGTKAVLNELEKAETFLKNFYDNSNEKAQKIRALYQGLVADTENKIKQLTSGDTQGTTDTQGAAKEATLYDKLNEKLKEYYELKKKIASVEKGSDEYKNLRNQRQNISNEILNMKELSEDAEVSLLDAFGNIDNTDVSLENALTDICKILQVDIPSSANIAANAAASGFARITQEANKSSAAIQKVMYHWGNLLSGKGKARDTFEDMPENLTTAVDGSAKFEQYGFGVLGGGLFGVSDPATLASENLNSKRGKFIQSIDLSKYNMYLADTEERATNLMGFLSKVQKFAIKGAEPNYTGFDEQLKGVNLDTLYDQFGAVFAEADFTKEQFNEFINEMVDLLRQAGLKLDEKRGSLDFTSIGNLKGTENISTRLLKKLGYQGVNVGGTSFDGYGQGSVLFNFNESDIVGYFNTVEQAIDDFKNRLNDGSWDGTNEQLQQYRKNIDGILSTLKEYKNNSPALAANEQVDNAISKLSQVQSNIDNILSGQVADGTGKQSIIAASVEEAGESVKEASQDLDVVSKKYHEFITLAETFSEIEYVSEPDVEKNINRLTELRNELVELGNQGKVTGDQLDVINSAFDKAEAENSHLRSENADLRKQLQDAKDSVASKDNADTTGCASKEAEEYQQLLNMINDVKKAVDDKTESFRAESETVGTVVDQEIQALTRLKENLETIQTLVQNIFNGQAFTVNGAELVEGATRENTISTSLQSIQSTLSSIYGVLQGFTGIKADNENSAQYKGTSPERQTGVQSLNDSADALNKAAQDISEQSQRKTPEQEQTDALRKKATEYSNIDDFVHKNVRDLMKVGVNSSELAKQFWREANYDREDFQPVAMVMDDVIDTIRDKVPGNILDGWFRDADSPYKARLETLALSDKDIRNAALNVMWDNYKNYSGKDIGFEEFLHSDVPVYRGKNSEKYVNGDELLSFTFDRAVAEKFGKHVLETMVKPIDTIGSYQTTAEGEVMVRRDKLEQLPGFQTWLDNMSGDMKQSFVQAIPDAVQQGLQEQVAAEKELADAAKETAAAKERQADAAKEAAKQEETAEQPKKDAEKKPASRSKYTPEQKADRGAYKTDISRLTGLANQSIKGLDFSLSSSDLEGQQKEIADGYKDAIVQIEKFAIAVKKGEQVEVSSIEATVAALMEKAKAYKQQNGLDKNGKKTVDPTKGLAKYQNIVTTLESKQNGLKKLIGQDSNLAESSVITSKLKEYEDSLTRLQNLYTQFQSKKPEDAEIVDFKDASAECNKLHRELDGLIKTYQKLHENPANDVSLNGFVNTPDNRQQALLDYVEMMYGSKAKVGDFENACHDLFFTIDNGDGTLTDAKVSIDNLGQALVETHGKTKEAKSSFASFADEVKGKFKSLTSYFTAMFGIQEVIQIVRQGIQYITEIDTALTELKKVTSETDATYNRFLQSMSKTAGVVGSTVKDLTTMASEWARLGYTLEESAKLAESTAILLNVSEFQSATEASEALISTMQAFQYTADESQHVVDILNEVKLLASIYSDVYEKDGYIGKTLGTDNSEERF